MICWVENQPKLIFPGFCRSNLALDLPKKSQFHGKLASLSMQLSKQDENLNWGCILVDTLIFFIFMLSLLCEMHALDTETRQGVRGRMKKGIIDYYDEAEAEELECFVFPPLPTSKPAALPSTTASIRSPATARSPWVVIIVMLCASVFTMSANVIVVVAFRIERKSLVNLLDAVSES